MTVFGCKECWPDDPESAWSARTGLKHSTSLVQESHFGAKTSACSSCGQAFVGVFVEEIDWADGEDPQYWTVLPVTPDEAAELSGWPSSMLLPLLNRIGRGRRCLRRDFPKGSDPYAYWAPNFSADPSSTSRESTTAPGLTGQTAASALRSSGFARCLQRRARSRPPVAPNLLRSLRSPLSGRVTESRRLARLAEGHPKEGPCRRSRSP